MAFDIKVYQKVWRAKNKGRLRIRQNNWREKNKEHHLRTRALWLAKNKDRVRAQQRAWNEKHPRGRRAYTRQGFAKRKERYREFITCAKNNPCMDCGVSYPHYVMDFDHRDSKTKLKNVSRMVNMNLIKIQQEINKCDLVCSNCHRIRTHNRRKQLPHFEEQGASNDE